MGPRGSRDDALPGGVEAPIYNTQAVARLTGVPAPTFRAWERRYNLPRPARLPGGQRLYSEADVELIRWLHARTAEGMTISRAVRLLEARRAEPTVEPAPAPRSFASLQADLLERLLAFDAKDAERVLSEALALFPLEDVCVDLIQPTLVEIGDRWHQGTLSVATEHFATQLIRRKLAALLQVYDGGDRDQPVLLACADDELHEIGLLLVALFLARRGWPVVYLGPSVPAADLLEAVRRLRPPLVILSASTEETARRLASSAELIHALPAPRPLVGYGGRVFDEADPPNINIPGVYLGPDARVATARATALLTGAPGPS